MCLGKDEEDFEQAIQKLEMRQFGSIFETAQAQISNLKHRDHEIYGLEEEVDWTSGHRRNFFFFKKKTLFGDGSLSLRHDVLEASMPLRARLQRQARALVCRDVGLPRYAGGGGRGGRGADLGPGGRDP